jgi:hypothetical protein
MDSKSLAERLRQLLDKADVLGLIADDDGQHEQAMYRGQAPVNRNFAAPPQGFRAKLMEARAQLLLEQTGWNQVTYEKIMHLKMCGDHELYQGVRRRVNTRPNGMGLPSNASAIRLAKGS